MRRRLFLVWLFPLACAEPAPLADAESPSAVWRAALARSEAEVFASDYARSSPVARRAAEEYAAGLAGSAWRLAEDEAVLEAPSFDRNDAIAALPGLFNPDNHYQSALLEPGGSYRITGRRGTHLQLLLQVLDAYPLAVLGASRLVIDVDALGVAPGDDFELWLGGAERPGAWYPLAEDARALIVRMTFADWESETPSTLRIDRLDAARPAPHGPFFARAAGYLDQMTALWTGTFMLRVRLAPLNDLTDPAPTRDGLVGQLSSAGRFELAEDEGLLVTASRGQAKYLGIQVGDPFLVTPDWIRHAVSLNHRQARADADGRIRVVVAQRDPGVPNWLDTAGHPQGFVFLRWQGVAAPLAAEEAPSAELVKLAALREKLPPETPVVDAEARARQLAGRRFAPVRK
jgi:hypothetical protein